MTQPPGTLKSITWCVSFPAWVWAKYPFAQFLLNTNEQKNVFRDANLSRKLVRSEWYTELVNDPTGARPAWSLSETQDQKLYFETTAGGHRLAVTTGGSTAGKKGHVLISDDLHDPVKVKSKTVRDSDKDWFRSGFSDRLVSFKTGAILVIGHRVDKEDIQSELIHEGWPHLDLPEEWSENRRKTWPVAVQIEQGGPRLRTDPRTEHGEFLRPNRFGPEEKERTIQTGGSLAYEAKHNQNPQRRSGAMFDYDKPRRVATWPVGTVAVWYFDTAASEGESACETGGTLLGKTPEGRFIVCKAEFGKWNPTVRNQKMRNRGLEAMRLSGLVFRKLYWEKGTSDSGLERDQLLARALAGIPCEADPAKGNKVQRAEAFAAQWAAGNVDIVEGDWNHEYLTRMSEFPTGRKDVGDSGSGAFNKLVLQDNDPELYATASPEETVFGNLPRGTFDNESGVDPYA